MRCIPGVCCVARKGCTMSFAPTMGAVAWALYSTEELARLMEEPFGSAGRKDSRAQGGGLETVPLDQVCDRIVAELATQALVHRRLDVRPPPLSRRAL